MKSKLLHPRLKVVAGKIADKKLREKVTELLENPNVTIDGKEYAGLPLSTAPAGLSHHHSYPGGYIEHVVSTVNIALALCTSVEKIYRGKVNHDVLIAGVLLHDIFKPVTYVVNEDGTYGASQIADYIDHLTIATSELVRRGFPLEVIHVVTAHHGQYGPIRPRTIEALICHLADLADSKLNGEVLYAAAYLTRRAVGEELRGLNSKEAFEIIHSKATEGLEGVADAVRRIEAKRRTHKA